MFLYTEEAVTEVCNELRTFQRKARKYRHELRLGEVHRDRIEHFEDGIDTGRTLLKVADVMAEDMVENSDPRSGRLKSIISSIRCTYDHLEQLISEALANSNGREAVSLYFLSESNSVLANIDLTSLSEALQRSVDDDGRLNLDLANDMCENAARSLDGISSRLREYHSKGTPKQIVDEEHPEYHDIFEGTRAKAAAAKVTGAGTGAHRYMHVDLILARCM